ncbi:MAG: hypothetical protein HUU16_00615 [Candidatus Omnitrophica bacterium]|nr:hypothetical protein [Candidatus Omnitrophota bacterium]
MSYWIDVESCEWGSLDPEFDVEGTEVPTRDAWTRYEAERLAAEARSNGGLLLAERPEHFSALIEALEEAGQSFIYSPLQPLVRSLTGRPRGYDGCELELVAAAA